MSCPSCNRTYKITKRMPRCDRCSAPLDLRYDLQSTCDADSEAFVNNDRWSLWRYEQLIGDIPEPVSLGEGVTPLVESTYLGSDLNLGLRFKLEHTNPTSSFKDRGVSVLISALKNTNQTLPSIADDSSGNAGSALAAYASRAQLDCKIYVPSDTSKDKLTQIRAYGASLIPVSGDRLEVARRIERDAADSDFLYASHNLHPLFPHGIKTLAFEISEQLNWVPPEHVIVPVGGGALIWGLYLGFVQLRDQGLISEIPQIHGIQSEACSPIVEAFDLGDPTASVDPAETVAEGIHIAQPPRSSEILEALENSGGHAISVTEREIQQAYRQFPHQEGIFYEPTSAASIAGLIKLNNKGVIQSGATAVVPITGSGLNDQQAAGLLTEENEHSQ